MADSGTVPGSDPQRASSSDKPPKTELSWQQVVTAVAAAAGGAPWVSAVGSGVVALRLRQAREYRAEAGSGQHRQEYGDALGEPVALRLGWEHLEGDGDRNGDRTPSFDETKITLRGDPGTVTGGYITSTEHSVVLSTRCEVIEAVPRDQIERSSVGPAQVTRTDC